MKKQNGKRKQWRRKAERVNELTSAGIGEKWYSNKGKIGTHNNSDTKGWIEYTKYDCGNNLINMR